MLVTINGKKENLKDIITITEFLEERRIRKEVVVIELNDKIIDKSNFDTTYIKENDRIELLYYMGGGSPSFLYIAGSFWLGRKRISDLLIFK